MMQKILHKRFFKICAIVMFACASTVFGADVVIVHSGSLSPKTQELRDKMRELWTDHGVWTHEYIVAVANNAPYITQVTDRLLQNQVDIGDAVAGFYGKSAGEKLTALLKEHILIAVDVVAAARDGNDKKLKDADKRWHKNADDISAFLSKANPAWPKADMLKTINEHLSLTTKEAVARLKAKWSEEVKVYDEVRSQLLQMADMFSDGIIKQYPAKFKLAPEEDTSNS
jgi:hypothetical protein